MYPYRIGAAYTPGLLPWDGGCSALTLPPFVSHVEMGLEELRLWDDFATPGMQSLEVSLHISRSAMAEEQASRDANVRHIAKAIESSTLKVTSVGLHLCGSRWEGMGVYGFTSHFEGTDEQVARATAFVKALEQETGLPVWLENANFYSPRAFDVLAVWTPVRRICAETNAQLIVDIAHMIIDCRNNNIDPVTMVGAIPWDSVAEVHLSGIRTGKDGSLHDGHSIRVHEEVWDILDLVLDASLLARGSVITVEHADPTWSKQPNDYAVDFHKALESANNDRAVLPAHAEGEKYAKAYLARLCSQHLPQLKPFCEQRGVDYDELFASWIQEIQSNGQRIVMRAAEVEEGQERRVVVAATSFLAYAKGQLG